MPTKNVGPMEESLSWFGRSWLLRAPKICSLLLTTKFKKLSWKSKTHLEVEMVDWMTQCMWRNQNILLIHPQELPKRIIVWTLARQMQHLSLLAHRAVTNQRDSLTTNRVWHLMKHEALRKWQPTETWAAIATIIGSPITQKVPEEEPLRIHLKIGLLWECSLKDLAVTDLRRIDTASISTLETEFLHTILTASSMSRRKWAEVPGRLMSDTTWTSLSKWDNRTNILT